VASRAVLADMIDYLQQDGVQVAVFDATNSTRERCPHILEMLKRSGIGAKQMFVESMCDSTELLEENIAKVKLSTPDYCGMKEEDAFKDFCK
jgi:putative N-acetylmannosamine-6-phosphate epimerase